MNTIVADEILSRIHNLPSLPTVVMELLVSMDQDDVNIDALAQTIARDQALTARTLRLANSSFYGVAGQVTNMKEAIGLLGFRTVRSLVSTASLIGNFPEKTRTSFDVTPFWRHAIAAAVCAGELAVHLNIDPDYAYTAGLLHDIGRLVLVTQFQAKYEATTAHRALHDCSLLDAEQAVLGIDHALVGHVLTRHWKFPEALQQAVAYHHAPVIQGMQPLSLVILAADAIAHALDLSEHMDDVVPPIPVGLWKHLGLNEETLLKVFRNAEKQFERASLVLRA